MAWYWEPILAGLMGFCCWLVVSFIMWRQMRLDYEEEKVLLFSGALGVAGVVGALVGRKFLSSSWWGIIIGLALVVIFWCRRNKWDFWDWADLLGPAFLGTAGVMSVVLEFPTVGEGLGLLAGSGAALWMRAGYRRLKWYKSGKMGFAGIFSLMWWAGVEIAVAIVSPLGIYWGGLTSMQWVGVWMLTTGLVLIYLRGGRNAEEDLKDIWGKIKVLKLKLGTR